MTGPVAAHGHHFLGARHARNARATRVVIAISLAMMGIEVVAGLATGSLALLADGVHMATHVGAYGIAALAYGYASRHAGNPEYSYGTGKVGALAGFASALILAGVAVGIGVESVLRLAAPGSVQFGAAIWVAVLGLGVNLVSAWVLWGGGHEHEHDHHRDENLRGALLHVLADALTSVLAIAGLVAGLAFGWLWADGVVGLIGAVVIGQWSVGMMGQAAATLLDRNPDPGRAEAVRRSLQQGGDRVVDLHLWRLGPGHLGLVVAIRSPSPQAPEHYKARLAHIGGLSHVTVEVNPEP